MSNEETWRPVVGFEGLYEVSDHGRIRRVGKAARTGEGRGGGARIGRVLRDQAGGNGYRVVQLWRDGRPRMRLVHCLVAAAFIGPASDGHDVNHRDGDKHHNARANLEYLTRGDNLRHAYRTGLRGASVEQSASARRKPRRAVACSCGCGVQLVTPDRKGRDRRFVTGHNMRRAVA